MSSRWCPRLRLVTFSGRIRNPSRGTRSISIFPSAPINRISQSGDSSRSLWATAMAGLICPAVPPQVKSILMPLPLQNLSKTTRNESTMHSSEMPVKRMNSSFSFHFLPVQPPISRW